MNVQVCWEKFCRYWDVEPRLVADGGRPLPPDRRAGGRAPATRTRSAWWRSSARPSTAATSRWARSAPRSTSSRYAAAPTSRCTWTPPPAGSSPRSRSPIWCGTSRLPRVHSINASGHKYGLVYPGVGWAIWREARRLPSDLVFDVNYLGGIDADLRAELLASRQRGHGPVLHVRLRSASNGYEEVQRASNGSPAHRQGDRRDRPLRTITDGSDLPVFAFTLTRGDQLHRVRRLRAAARVRLAGAGLHVPREPGRPVRAAHSRARGLTPTWRTCSSPTCANRPLCSSRSTGRCPTGGPRNATASGTSRSTARA